MFAVAISDLWIVLRPLALVDTSNCVNVRTGNCITDWQKNEAFNEVACYIELIKMHGWEASSRKSILGNRQNQKTPPVRNVIVHSANTSVVFLTTQVAVIHVIYGVVALGGDIASPGAYTCFILLKSMSYSVKAILVALEHVGSGCCIALLSLTNRVLSVSLNRGSRVLSSQVLDSGSEWLKHSWHRRGIWHNSRQYLLDDNVDTLYRRIWQHWQSQSCLLFMKWSHNYKTEGSQFRSFKLSGSTAYCAQQACIKNATIWDKISIGSPYVKSKYDRITVHVISRLIFWIYKAAIWQRSEDLQLPWARKKSNASIWQELYAE